MFDPRKIREGYEVTVGMLIQELSKEDLNAPVTICGDPHIVIHVNNEDEEKGVCLDSEYLFENYEEDLDAESIRAIEPIVFDRTINF